MNEGPITVLSVAYPFSAVGVDGTGGAEQVLALVDRALVLAGHRSIVIAHEASEVLGTLVPIADPGACVDAAAALRTHAAVRDALDRTLRAFPIDVVHAHGIDFDRYVDPDTPVLFFSGAACEADRKRGIAAGANDYVIKPDLDGLLGSIKRFISGADGAPAKVIPFERKVNFSSDFTFEPAA